MGPVRQTLRETTAAAHQRLHIHPVLAPLTNASLTIDQYRIALQALYGLHSAADSRLSNQWPERQKRSPHLANDLQSLGVAPITVPIFTDMTTYATPAAYLGGRYVMDGSYFGIRALASNVRRTLGLDTNTGGASFLDASELDMASEWRKLLIWLEELNTQEERKRVQRAAELTFSEVGRWLDTFSYVHSTDPEPIDTTEKG